MLGDTIRRLRTENDWSQADLAERCDTSQQNINRYENGTEPKSEMIKRLSAAFGVTVSYLLGMDDDPNPHGIRLTRDECRLMELFRGTDDRGRSVILAMAEMQPRGRR